MSSFEANKLIAQPPRKKLFGYHRTCSTKPRSVSTQVVVIRIAILKMVILLDQVRPTGKVPQLADTTTNRGAWMLGGMPLLRAIFKCNWIGGIRCRNIQSWAAKLLGR